MGTISAYINESGLAYTTDLEDDGGGKMKVYIGVVVSGEEDEAEVVYTSEPFVAGYADQAKQIVLTEAVRKDQDLDAAGLTVCLFKNYS
jgi:hypothetical protein